MNFLSYDSVKKDSKITISIVRSASTKPRRFPNSTNSISTIQGERRLCFNVFGWQFLLYLRSVEYILTIFYFVSRHKYTFKCLEQTSLLTPQKCSRKSWVFVSSNCILNSVLELTFFYIEIDSPIINFYNCWQVIVVEDRERISLNMYWRDIM